MKKLIQVLCISTVFLACKDEKKEPTVQTTTTDSVAVDSSLVEHVDTVLTEENFRFFDQTGFSGHAKQQMTGFNWDRFRLVNVYREDSPVVSKFQPVADYYKNYGSFLRYSPDSSMFIDLDSYNISIRTDAKGKKTGQELGPDTEVSLVDLEANRKQRLVFTGPGGTVEDGTWIDNETLVLVGTQESAVDSIRTAVVWKYHIPTQSFYLYEIPEPLTAQRLMTTWRKKRLKGVAFTN